MQVWIDGIRAAALPRLSQEERLHRARILVARFRWDENLYRFHVNTLNAMRRSEGNASTGN